MEEKDSWLDWAVELQSLAQAGLYYTKDVYDAERFARVREIAAQMLRWRTELPLSKIKDLFCGEVGYQTPKIDTRAALIEDGRILLVREKNSAWSLPGGWCDVNVSVGENALKELREEAGLEAVTERVVAILDRDRHNRPRYAYKVCQVFVLCRRLSGSFCPNAETTASGWFSMQQLPPLATEKNTREQLQMCFDAHAAEHWTPILD